ncbi:MBL fold metallo-hydrolase [Alkaliphilus serpentinus]|uniref:MBL fold metallo-hydrolase n=1 Tax=Alkaliphilus serpentinus TaxID=1482731 RepID=A0A833M7S4_9FIRM|nr:MBL fold metallo-hydrolase [Alkaliphilus serpentinus]KAB3529183.1 MBL fold metallo-hydrolase [Alkaliphilus serpentinus]
MDVKYTIRYLHHSSFTIETLNHLLIFDYFHDVPPKGKERNIENGVVTRELLKTDKDILVFVTHSHSDHYNPVIFQWEQINPNITYILSSDIKVEKPKKNYYFLDKYEGLEVNGLVIEAFGSTDQGVSFYIEVEGLSIFHSGDLNWWHWKEFSKEKQLQEEVDFKNELKYLSDKNIDISFVPVDPRLEEYYYLAGKYFAENIKPKLMVPMHFGDHFEITNRIAEKLETLPVKVPTIHRRGQVIR